MSLLDRVTVLDVRRLSFPSDCERVTEWARANPPGWLSISDALPIGAEPEGFSWFAAAAASNAWGFRAHAQRQGVEVRFVVSWRGEIVSPLETKFVRRAPRLELDQVAARAPVGWREALEPFAAAGWRWEWWHGLTPEIEREIPADAVVYFNAPGVDRRARTFQITGLVAAFGSRAWREIAVDHARRTVAAWRADALQLPVKPWERAGVELPATPDSIGDWGGLVQPTPFSRRGEWELATSDLISDLGAAGVPLITQTRPTTPSLVSLIGNATASAAVLGEVDLRSLP